MHREFTLLRHMSPASKTIMTLKLFWYLINLELFSSDTLRIIILGVNISLMACLWLVFCVLRTLLVAGLPLFQQAILLHSLFHIRG